MADQKLHCTVQWPTGGCALSKGRMASLRVSRKTWEDPTSNPLTGIVYGETVRVHTSVSSQAAKTEASPTLGCLDGPLNLFVSFYHLQ